MTRTIDFENVLLDRYFVFSNAYILSDTVLLGFYNCQLKSVIMNYKNIMKIHTCSITLCNWNNDNGQLEIFNTIIENSVIKWNGMESIIVMNSSFVNSQISIIRAGMFLSENTSYQYSNVTTSVTPIEMSNATLFSSNFYMTIAPDISLLHIQATLSVIQMEGAETITITNSNFQKRTSLIVSLVGFINIQECNFTDNVLALSIQKSKEIAIDLCRFTRNRDTLFVASRGKMDIRFCEFIENYSYYGGAIRVEKNTERLLQDGKDEPIGVLIMECLFRDNSAVVGGVLYIIDSYVWIQTSSFINNSAIAPPDCNHILCGSGGVLYKEGDKRLHFGNGDGIYVGNRAVKGGLFYLRRSSALFYPEQEDQYQKNSASLSGNLLYLDKSTPLGVLNMNPKDCGSSSLSNVTWRATSSVNGVISHSSDSIGRVDVYPGLVISLELIISDEFGNVFNISQLAPSITSQSQSFVNVLVNSSTNTSLTLSLEVFGNEKEVMTVVHYPHFDFSFNIQFNVVDCPRDYGLSEVGSSRNVCVFKNHSTIIATSVLGGILMAILMAGGMFGVFHVVQRLVRLYKKERSEKLIEKKIIGKQFVFDDLSTPLMINLQQFSSSSILIAIEEIDIIKRIGEGSMGIVYLASWNGTQVALKSIKLDSSDSTENQDDEFEHEASLLSSLRHPSIVRLLGVSLTSSTKYMVVEYLKGGSLENAIYLSKNGTNKLHLRKKVEILKGIASGMNYLHSLKPRALIHRDLKPANILLDSNMEPKVCDFGISKLSSKSGMTQMTMNLGTILYMAPELIGGNEEISTSLDVYSFSIIMYELFFEETPFYGESSTKIQRFTKSSDNNLSSKSGLYIPVKVVQGERPKIPWRNHEELSQWLSEFTQPFEPNNTTREQLEQISQAYIDLMERSWNGNPQLRPTFMEITKSLESMLIIL